ncbi:MAG: hypothetical protein JJE47_15420 [Acidimicrobiia bacterium]|nr:hypothetical protein [Acidimicrobiia bacterium]
MKKTTDRLDEVAGIEAMAVRFERLNAELDQQRWESNRPASDALPDELTINVSE